MKKNIISLCLLTLICLQNYSYAEVAPIKNSYDARIKTVIYNENNVTKINTKIGVVTLIRFSKGEVIDEKGGLALGDPLAWDISTRGSNLFLRPKAKQADTNLTVVTNKRTYFFSLTTVKNNKDVDFSVKLIYTDDAVKKTKEPLPRCFDTTYDKFYSDLNYNYNYEGRGSKEITPLKVYDDGDFTCILLPPKAKIPAVFKKEADKSESLTNYHIVGNMILVHDVVKELRLRLGTEVFAIRRK